MQEDDQTSIEESQAFEELLDFCWERYQFDFTTYKRSSLMRRMQQRLQAVAIASYQEYIDYLKKYPEEFKFLFQSIPVSYTQFFRDAHVWEQLSQKIIPQILSRLSGHQSIKVWSAGCATGEETYTLAILLLEALGEAQFKRGVRIYGTDLDYKALHRARQGCYSSDRVVGVAPTLLEQYFEQTDQTYTFRKDLRSPIVFLQHDLMQDPPFSQIDLLVCRNTLIYFTNHGQIRALVRAYFGLKEGGFLVLGNTETPMLSTGGALFTPVDYQHRIFAKVAQSCTSRLLTQAFKRQEPTVHEMSPAS